MQYRFRVVYNRLFKLNKVKRQIFNSLINKINYRILLYKLILF